MNYDKVAHCTHYKPNTNNHSISIHEGAPEGAEEFQLDEIASN